MSDKLNESDEVRQPTSPHAVIIDDAQEVTRNLRICPRKVLGSLSHLRIDGARVKPMESQAVMRAGGKADVEAAILTSAQLSSSSKPEVPEYVAVKKLRFDSETDDDQALAPFAHEVSLLNGLSHGNVVKIIGFIEDVHNGVAWMVFSWEKNGNLREFVRAENWELPERLSLIADVAEGLSYLHERSPPICHGDLKSLNILVNSGNRAVITDFGSARFVELGTETVVRDVNIARATKTEHQPLAAVPNMESLKTEIAESGEFITITGPAWTLRWAAPELLCGVPPGLGSDVWAFGWICWEVVTGNFPFHEENDVAVVQRILTKNLPTIGNHSQLNQIKTLCHLMEECLKLDAAERPSATRCQQVISWMDQTIPSRRGGDNVASPRSSGLLHALGRLQLQNGVIDEAQEYFRQSIDVSKSTGDERGEARAIHAMGATCHLWGDYSEATKWYRQSWEIYHNIGDSLGAAQLTKALAAVYRFQYDYSKAEGLYIQSGDLYSKIGYRPEVTLPADHPMKHVLHLGDREYTGEGLSRQLGDGFVITVKDELKPADSLYALGEDLFVYNNYSQAEEVYLKSREIYSKLRDQFGVARSFQALGNVYLAQDEYSKADESYVQSRDICSRIGDQVGFAQSVKALGDVYRMRNEYSKAEELYVQSRDLYSRVGDQLGSAHSIKALGDVYRMQGEYPKAEESYVESRDLCSKLGDRLGFAHSAKALGDAYCNRNEYSKAEESYIQSRNLYSIIGNQLGFANSVRALTDVRCILEKYGKAEESHIEPRNISSRAEDQLSLACSLDEIARVQSVMGQYAKAEESFLEAQRIYNQVGDIHSSAKISWYMGLMYRRQERYQEAERVVREASTMYSELGQTEQVGECDDFLAEISRLPEN